MGEIWDFSWFFFEKYGRYMGEIIRKTDGDAILTLFASIFSTTPADFVLYFPIFSLNEKEILLLSKVRNIPERIIQISTTVLRSQDNTQTFNI